MSDCSLSSSTFEALGLHAARWDTSGRRCALALSAILVSGFLAATNGSPTIASQSQAAGKGQRIRYVMKSFKQSAMGCGPDKRQECAWIEVTYPVIRSGPVALKAAVNRRVFEATFGKQTPKTDKMAARWVANGLDSLAQDRKNCRLDCGGSWFDQVRVEAESNLPFTFTISIVSAWYHGTAHPYEFTSFENYQPASGRMIALGDIFKPGGKLKLERIAERLFREEEGLSPKASLRGAGFFGESNRFHLSENFALYDHELILYYNLYEIATYADGITVITIPYRDIRHLLRPESSILPYAR